MYNDIMIYDIHGYKYNLSNFTNYEQAFRLQAIPIFLFSSSEAGKTRCQVKENTQEPCKGPIPCLLVFVLVPVFAHLLVHHLDLLASDELKRKNRDCS